MCLIQTAFSVLYIQSATSAESTAQLIQMKELRIILSPWRSQDLYGQDRRGIFGVECEKVRTLGAQLNDYAVAMPGVTGLACKSSPARVELAFGVLEDAFHYLEGDKLLKKFAQPRKFLTKCYWERIASTAFSQSHVSPELGTA